MGRRGPSRAVNAAQAGLGPFACGRADCGFATSPACQGVRACFIATVRADRAIISDGGLSPVTGPVVCQASNYGLAYSWRLDSPKMNAKVCIFRSGNSPMIDPFNMRKVLHRL